MAPIYFLAIDIGTQSNRAALVDTSGRIVANTAVSLDMESPAPGWAQQDARLWWQTTVGNIQTLLRESSIQPSQIAGVAACGQMHAAIPINSQGEVLLSAVQLWCDKRSAHLIDELKDAGEHAQAFRQVGNVPAPAWWGWKLKWMQLNQADVYARTWKFLTSAGYIVYQLTGQPCIDLSEASGSYLLDVIREQWSADMIGLMDLEIEKLPPIYSSGYCVGGITPEASNLTGLLAGTPVAAGAGDMLSTLLAAGLTLPGQAVDITGTSTIFNVFNAQPILDKRMMNLHHCLPGWITFGISDSGGGALKWFKDAFCHEEIAASLRIGKSPYRLLDEQAAGVEPGCEGLLFFPYLLGERTLGSPYSRGVFFGLTPRSNKAAMARAIMEGVVFEMRRTMEIVETFGTSINEIRSVGGGAQSPLWCQIRADIYQKPVAILKTFEGGILGSAMLAGVASGVYLDETEAVRHVVKVDHVIQPNPLLAERYTRLYSIYKELHDQMLPSFIEFARTE